MAESIHEQIAAKIQSLLAAIRGDDGATYWYTPSVVGRVVWFQEEQLDASVETVYLIRPGDETISEEATGSSEGRMEVFLFLAHRYVPSSETVPSQEIPIRWTVVDRMIRDVLKALLLPANVTLGGLAINVMAEAALIERDRYLGGWACAEMRLPIAYTFLWDAP